MKELTNTIAYLSSLLTLLYLLYATFRLFKSNQKTFGVIIEKTVPPIFIPILCSVIALSFSDGYRKEYLEDWLVLHFYCILIIPVTVFLLFKLINVLSVIFKAIKAKFSTSEILLGIIALSLITIAICLLKIAF